MRWEFLIATRYLFSKKSTQIIQVISGISLVVVAFVSAAMVIVMSAFAGIEDLVDDLFNHFDAPVVIQHQTQSTFLWDESKQQYWSSSSGVKACCPVLENDVWVNYHEANTVVLAKGVPSNYGQVNGMAELMYAGKFQLDTLPVVQAVAGLGVCGQLLIPVNQRFEPQTLVLRAPIPGKKLSRFRENAFKEIPVTIDGVFSANAELDVKYIFVPLQQAQVLFDSPNKVSSVEVYFNQEEEAKNWIEANQAMLNADSLEVVSRDQKNALINKTTKSEKWATFLILVFILIIASFNIVASLSMLIIEKTKDIKVLNAMGVTPSRIQRIFMLEGMLINAIGGVLGVTLGILVCLGQQHFGWITMEGAVVDHYPIKIEWVSVLGILFTVLMVGTFFCWTMVRFWIKPKVELND
jgi:lipoprotein-releasing system permease protein